MTRNHWMCLAASATAFAFGVGATGWYAFGTELSFCPGSVDLGTFGEWAGVAATVVIAFFAHRLNDTLRTNDERRSNVAARVFLVSVLVDVRVLRALAESIEDSAKEFLAGEVTLGAVESSWRGARMSEASPYLYQSQAIGDLPHEIALQLADFVGEHRILMRMLDVWFSVASLPLGKKVDEASDSARNAVTTISKQITVFLERSDRLKRSAKEYLKEVDD